MADIITKAREEALRANDPHAALMRMAYADTALADAMLRKAAKDILGEGVRTERAAIWSGARPTAVQKVRTPCGGYRVPSAGRLRAMTAVGLLSFPLPTPGGKPLGDATRQEVEAGADAYVKQASDMSAKGRWLSAVAALVKDGKTVRESLKPEKLLELQEATVNA